MHLYDDLSPEGRYSADLETALMDCLEARRLNKSNVKAAYWQASVLAAMERWPEANKIISEMLHNEAATAAVKESFKILQDSLPSESRQLKYTASEAGQTPVSPTPVFDKELRSDASQGRFYVAATDLKEGDSVHSEFPLAAVVCKDQSTEVLSLCLLHQAILTCAAKGFQ